jgi:uncharacterized lipoprotein NlpE involved in copper resistance
MKQMNLKILIGAFLITGSVFMGCENRQEMAGDNVHVPVGTTDGDNSVNTTLSEADTLDSLSDSAGAAGNNSLNSDNTVIREDAMTDTTLKMK